MREPPTNATFIVPLNGTANTSGTVSFPFGVTQETVVIYFDGMSGSTSCPANRAAIEVRTRCTGTGTEFVLFTVNSKAVKCGELLADGWVTGNTGAATITVRAVGGANTAVAWVITATSEQDDLAGP